MYPVHTFSGVNGECVFCFPLNAPLVKANCPVTCAGQANGAAFSVVA